MYMLPQSKAVIFSAVAMIEVCLEQNSTDDTPGTSLRQYMPGAGAINRAPTTAHAWSETQQVYPGALLNRAIGTLTIITHH